MRNKRPVSYKNYLSTSYVTDSQGRKTGTRKAVYGDAKTIFCSVSTPTGSVSLDMFGTDKDYNKIVVVDDTSIDITENSIFWIDKPYSEGSAHDYIVTKILRNHNFLTIGLRCVDVAKVVTPNENNKNQSEP